MKKAIFLGACLLLGAGAMIAQEAVLKEAERAMKKGEDYSAVLQIVTPAMSDPNTANDVLTYYIPGKAGYNQFDKLYAKDQLGQLDDAGRLTKAQALLGGYNYLMKALPLDTVVDAKGKVKTKYSKDIVNTIGGHYNDLYATGIDFWNAKDYQGAYDIWQAYVSLPNNPTFVKALNVTPPDSTLAEIMYNQALAAWQMDNMPLALDAFINAKNHGYQKKNLYDYAIAVASSAGNTDAVTMLAKEAQQLYGDEDPNYIGYIINNCISEKRYKDAVDMIDTAIAANPDNAQYYVIKGILFETDEVDGDPEPQYAKAVELDSHNAQALYNLGRMYYNRALTIYNDAPAENEAFNKVFNEEFKPEMLKAVDLFGRATAIDENNTDALKLLEQAYYMLNDDANLKATQARLGN